MQTDNRDARQTPWNTSLVPCSEAAHPECASPKRDDTACVIKGEGTFSAENRHLAERIISTFRVPVIAVDGETLMPTKASRARRWLADGKAKPIETELGLFVIQLIIEPSGRKKQQIAIGIDPGSSYTGMAVASKKAVLCGFNLELPTHVSEKMQHRSMLRRGRRHRKCRRRESRFLNRSKSKIAPSILSRKLFELRILKELANIYPISDIVIEDVRFNHYSKKWGMYFSQIEIGKNWLIIELEKLTHVQLFDGWETSEKRKELNLEKSSDKSERNQNAHVNDAIALCSLVFSISDLRLQHFDVIRRPLYNRRKLHLENPAKNGLRRSYGGTTMPFIFRKGDYVCGSQGKKIVSGWISGCTKNAISVSDFDWNRLGQFTIRKVRLLKRNSHILLQSKEMKITIPPSVETGGLLVTML